jgi:hypothetical protein
LREFLEEPLGIGHTKDMAGIVVAEEESPAFGVGEAAEDLEVVIVPSGFPFGGLVFRHGEASMKYEGGRMKAPALPTGTSAFRAAGREKKVGSMK